MIQRKAGQSYMRVNKISELGAGNYELYLLVRDIQTKTARNGSTYLVISFSDGRDTLSANMWDTLESSLDVKAKEIAFVSLEGKLYNSKTGIRL